MKVKRYYDGVNIEEHINLVDGVTTNTSYVAEAEVTDYDSFINKSIESSKGKPISFQVTGPSSSSIIKQAEVICQKASNVYVKIPIVLPNGESTKDLVQGLSKDGFKVNVTCIHTEQQTIEACNAVSDETKSIISLFAGGLSDSGTYAKPIFDKARSIIGDNANKQILYAGCQRVFSIVEAELWGADIITIPDGVMKKLDRMDFDDLETSIKKSQLFFYDGSKLTFTH